MQAVILAGGLGTRLRESVKDVAKPMAPINGRPFLEYLIEHLISFDITNITLSVGYLSGSIIDHFGSSYKTAKINYSTEHEPLGTGGAIANALSQMTENPFLVLNGDTFLSLDYHKLIDWYSEKPNDLSLVVRNVPNSCRYDRIECDSGKVTGIYGKGHEGPGFINAGIYIIKPSFLKQIRLKNKFSFEEDILKKNWPELELRAFISSDYFIDIGIPEDYTKAQIDLPASNIQSSTKRPK